VAAENIAGEVKEAAFCLDDVVVAADVYRPIR
jgi:hypothetical protein